MSHIGTQGSTQSRLFPVEWPLVSKTRLSSQKITKHMKKTKGIKKRKTKVHKSTLTTQKMDLRVGHAVTADQQTHSDDKEKQHARETHVASNEVWQEVMNDVICEPQGSRDDGGNILKCLDGEEVKWLAEEVHQVNKEVFGTEKTAERLKKNYSELNDKKASLNALKNLLKDLSWNIKYPDEQTAKGLHNLDEASNNFGVRNMVNYLNLLDGYFSQLQTQLDK